MWIDKLALWALWVAVFVIPWEGTVAVPGLGSVTRIIGALALGLSVLTVLATGVIRRPQPFHWMAFAFVGWSTATILWAENPSGAQTRVLTYAQLALFAMVIWQHARTERRQLALLQAYVMGAYGTGLATLTNYLADTWAGSAGRYAAAGVGPNEVAMVLVLGIPLAWYLAFSIPSRRLSMLNTCYVPLAVTVVMLTASRGGFIAMLAALLFIPSTLHRLSIRARVGATAAITIGVVATAVVVPQASWERLGETTEQIQEGNFTGRGVIWTAGLQVFADHPITGVGAGGFSRAVEPALGYAASPHQTFLSILVGQGLIGLLLFLGMLAAAFWSVHRMRGLQRKVWAVLALTLAIGLLPRTWDYRKPLWFILSVAAAQSAAVVSRRSTRPLPAMEQRIAPPLPSRLQVTSQAGHGR